MKKKIIDEILNEMNNISYGFVDRYGVVHTRIKLGFYMKEYRLQSPEITDKYKVGTCWDQVELIREILNKNNINTETYLFDYDEEGVLAKHTIAVALIDGKYYWMESSWKGQEDFSFVDDINIILRQVVEKYPAIYKIKNYNEDKLKIYKYDKVQSGVTFDEFCAFCRNGEVVSLD